MIECVPALTEVVQDGSSSGSDGEGGEDEDNLEAEEGGKKSISPGHARDTDAAEKVVSFDHFVSQLIFVGFVRHFLFIFIWWL